MVTCTFAFSCSKKWGDLAPTDEPTVRYCSDCRQQVYQVESETEIAVAVALKRCVAARSNSEPEWEMGDLLAGIDESTVPRPVRVLVHLRRPVQQHRFSILRLKAPALFDAGLVEQSLIRGEVVRLRLLPQPHAALLIAELARCAPELEASSEA